MGSSQPPSRHHSPPFLSGRSLSTGLPSFPFRQCSPRCRRCPRMRWKGAHQSSQPFFWSKIEFLSLLGGFSAASIFSVLDYCSSERGIRARQAASFRQPKFREDQLDSKTWRGVKRRAAGGRGTEHMMYFHRTAAFFLSIRTSERMQNERAPDRLLGETFFLQETHLPFCNLPE